MKLSGLIECKACLDNFIAFLWTDLEENPSKCRRNAEKNLKKHEAEFMARPEGIRAKNKVIFEIPTVK